MKTIVAILALTLLGACSSNTPNTFSRITNSTYNSYGDFVEKQHLKKIDQIDELAFWNIWALDNDYAMLSVKRNNYYVLALDESCQGMEFAERFGVIQRDENKLNINDRLVRLSDKNTQCLITSIYKLHQVQFQELGSLKARSRNENLNGMAQRR